MNRKFKLALVHAGLLMTLVAFQNCAKVSMTSVATEDPNGSSSEPGKYICSPFHSNSKTGSTHGIKTELRYISPQASLTNEQKSQIPAKQYFESNPHFVQVPANLYFSDINIPSRRFENGFTSADGSQLRDNQGNLLVEYFALRMESILQLGPGDLEGYYELAVVSDDGTVLQFKENGQWVDYISNDGPHSTQMGCMNRRIYLTKNSRIPFRVIYNQGARYEIANVLIWNYRGTDPTAVPAGAFSDSEIRTYCGRASNEAYWNPSTSQEGEWAQNMSTQGWKPLTSDNFLLPNNETNPCASEN